MQFFDVLCYVFLTITVAASCVEINDKQADESTEKQLGKRISKRELVKFEVTEKQFQVPKVIYKRISQAQKFIPPGSKASAKFKYRTRKPKTNRKSNKKHKYLKHLSSKYLPQSNKNKRNKSRPRYGPPKPRPFPNYSQSMGMSPYSPNTIESAGFGEPPNNYVNNYPRPLKEDYGEPPVDSYGIRLQYSKQVYPGHPIESPDSDNVYAYSKKYPTIYKPEVNDFFDFDNKPSYLNENSKLVKRPWKVHKKKKQEDDIIVGGQYAEPPPRFALNTGSVLFEQYEDVMSPQSYSNIVRPLPHSSAYMNYKNSNVAFSPQNLNDAFSLIDK